MVITYNIWIRSTVNEESDYISMMNKRIQNDSH